MTKLWGERENKNRVLVDYWDILWIVAEAKEVYMHTAAGDKLLVCHTLKEPEPHLTPPNFARVHKGYLSDLDHVAEWCPGSPVLTSSVWMTRSARRCRYQGATWRILRKIIG